MSRIVVKRTKCETCTKTVYPQEQVIADNKNYHKKCFKCIECNKTLSPSSFRGQFGKIYCAPCVEKIFKQSGGNYSKFSEGVFKNQSAREKRAAQGTPSSDDTSSSSPTPKTSTSSTAKKTTNTPPKSFSSPKKAVEKTKPAAVARKSSGRRNSFGGSRTKCETCEKTVYPQEQVIADNKTYHKKCFKCIECSKKLTPSSFRGQFGKIYCAPCVEKIFKQSGGNYSKFSEGVFQNQSNREKRAAQSKINTAEEAAEEEEVEETTSQEPEEEAVEEPEEEAVEEPEEADEEEPVEEDEEEPDEEEPVEEDEEEADEEDYAEDE